MANTTAVYARIDTGLKENAEEIAKSRDESFGYTYTNPTAIGGMSREELDAELRKGVESLKSAKTYTADQVDAELAKEFGI